MSAAPAFPATEVCCETDVSCATDVSLCNGSHHDRRHAARHDMGEIAEVGGDIQGKTMAADPTAEPHANGGDFAVSHPHARLPFNAPRGYAAVPQRIDQCLFEVPQVAAHVTVARPQVEDGISHQLPRAVIRRQSATIYLNHGRSQLMKVLRRGKHLTIVSPATYRVSVRMLQQQHDIGDRFRMPRRHQAPLQLPRSAIRHRAQIY